MTAVAVIGVGRMGGHMARHLAAAGFDTGVYDISPDLVARVASEIGARALRSPSDFGDAEIVITMLPTGKVVSSVLFETGIAESLPAGALVIDMSSSNPADTLRNASLAAELGLGFLDAPVSGGVGGAEAGTLTIMLGGDDADARRATPVLESMSSRIYRTGPVGSGHAMKALNNVVAGATTLACFEALAAGAEYGLSTETMVDIWNHSTARSFVTEVVMQNHVVTNTFDTDFALPLYAKDVGVADEMARAANVEVPVIRLVAEEFAKALNALGDVDHTKIFALRSK